jgi:hypothetical protein
MGLHANGAQVLLRSFNLLVGLCLVIPLLFGDGGTVQFQKQAGPFLVTIFSAPVPLRVGAADLSVMVQRATDRSNLLDCSVDLRLSRPGESRIHANATRAQATNKLMYAARVVFPAPGKWHLDVGVNAQRDTIHVAGDVPVLPQQEPLIAYWPYFAVLPTALVLFGLNQWLKAKRNVRNPRARP